MANISETPSYDAGVYQLETSDPVQGGAAGVDNAPHKNLANRTAYLKQALDAVSAVLATLKSAAFKDAGSSAGQVLLIDGTGKLPAVDGSQLTNVAGGLGYGQAWTDVHASRARNSIYQNTTGKPIDVSISLSFDANFTASALVASTSPPGVVVVAAQASVSSGEFAVNLRFEVPPGHYYKYTSSIVPSLSTGWAELR